jgi:hypothetical protein
VNVAPLKLNALLRYKTLQSGVGKTQWGNANIFFAAFFDYALTHFMRKKVCTNTNTSALSSALIAQTAR